MADSFKLAEAFVGISLHGVEGLHGGLKSAKSLFDDAGAAMQSSMAKSMKSVHAMFQGLGQTTAGVGGITSGLAKSMTGLSAAAGGLARNLAGIGSPTQNMASALAGARAVLDGAGASARGFGQSFGGLQGVLRGGVGALSGVSAAAMHASRALMKAGSSSIGAGFQKTFAAARSAASSFASGGSAAMRAFTSSVGNATSAVRSAASSMGGSFSSILSHLHPLRMAMVGIAAIGAGGFGMTKLASDAEATEVAFGTMLGGGDKGKARAKQVMADLVKEAAATPFELPELTGASRKLLAFGTEQKQLVGTLRMVGDVASGIQAPIGEIAEIYGKAKVQGRLFAEDINQLTGRGIPIIGELAKQFDVSESEVKKLVEQGKVGFPELEKAFQAMTAEGGKFHGMMAEQSKTAKGLWSTLADNVKSVARDLGSAMLPAIKEVMGAFIGMTGDASSWVDPLKAKISDLSSRLVANLPAIVGWFKQAFVYVKAWGQTQVAFFGAVARVVGHVATALTGLLPSVKGLGESFLKAEEFAKFFWDHFETYMLLAWEHTKLFASNSYERIKTFFQNVGVVLKWLWDNWKNIFQTMWDFTKTVIQNIGHNFAEFFRALKEAMKGHGFHFKGKWLLEGFESSISEMPEMLRAKIRETTPELNRLYDELGKARKKYTDEGKEGPFGDGDYERYRVKEEGDDGGEKSRSSATGGKIAFHGLAEFAKHIQGGAASKENQAEARDKKKTKAAEESAKNSSRIANAVERLHQGGLLIIP